MAITKIHAIKSTLGKALAYIENPDKTEQGHFVRNLKYMAKFVE